MIRSVVPVQTKPFGIWFVWNENGGWKRTKSYEWLRSDMSLFSVKSKSSRYNFATCPASLTASLKKRLHRSHKWNLSDCIMKLSSNWNYGAQIANEVSLWAGLFCHVHQLINAKISLHGFYTFLSSLITQMFLQVWYKISECPNWFSVKVENIY